MRTLYFSLLLFIFVPALSVQLPDAFDPGGVWLDTDDRQGEHLFGDEEQIAFH